MPSKNLHETAFDKSTLAKLEIFEKYAQAWLPTFVMQDKYSEVHIVDFFAGPGLDVNNVKGSPIRLIDKVIEQKGYLFLKKTKVYLHLNELDTSKYKALINNCNARLSEEKSIHHVLEIIYYNNKTEDVFSTIIEKIRGYPALLYIDQNGLKFISSSYLIDLEKLDKTDFIYFTASSYLERLWSTQPMKNIIEIDPDEIKNEKHSNMHRFLVEKLRSKLPPTSNLRLLPFSLKKNQAIYGLIFGSKNYLAIDKFLTVTWGKNPDNGEANFDIEEDQSKSQLSIFDGKKMTKLEKFKDDVRSKVLSGEIKNNRDALLYTYDSGHLPKHTNDLLRQMKSEKKITFDGTTPAVAYKYVFKSKDKRNIIYNVT